MSAQRRPRGRSAPVSLALVAVLALLVLSTDVGFDTFTRLSGWLADADPPIVADDESEPAPSDPADTGVADIDPDDLADPTESVAACDGVELAVVDDTQPITFDAPADGQRDCAQALIDTVAEATVISDEDYDRDAFGESWPDVTGNGCDTRNDMLARDLADAQVDDDGCTVASGVLADPLHGEQIAFERGVNSSEVHIDHLYPLAMGWRMGAASWGEDLRVAFANDPLNLAAVDGAANMAKGDAGPGGWMPDDAGMDRCGYSARFAAVALRYDLPVQPEDKQTMTAACADG